MSKKESGLNVNPDTTEYSDTNAAQTMPKPVFMRMVMLFGGGIGCLFVGIIVTQATSDTVLLIMSAILGVAFVSKGYLLRRKIKSGLIYNVSGVCVSIVPKLLGRYRRIELVDTNTGNDTYFILPKKIVFKIGHVYTCYFDNDIKIGNRGSVKHLGDKSPSNNDIVSGNISPESNSEDKKPTSNNTRRGRSRFFSADMDLPTNGFLGFEDFGVYQERPTMPAMTEDAMTEDAMNEDALTDDKDTSDEDTSIGELEYGRTEGDSPSDNLMEAAYHDFEDNQYAKNQHEKEDDESNECS